MQLIRRRQLLLALTPLLLIGLVAAWLALRVAPASFEGTGAKQAGPAKVSTVPSPRAVQG